MALVDMKKAPFYKKVKEYEQTFITGTAGPYQFVLFTSFVLAFKIKIRYSATTEHRIVVYILVNPLKFIENGRVIFFSEK